MCAHTCFLQQNTNFTVAPKQLLFFYSKIRNFQLILKGIFSLSTKYEVFQIVHKLLFASWHPIENCKNMPKWSFVLWPRNNKTFEGALKRPLVFCLRITEIELNLFFFQWTLNNLKKKQTKLLAHLSQNDFLK